MTSDIEKKMAEGKLYAVLGRYSLYKQILHTEIQID